MELASMLVRVGITGVSTVESGLSRVDRAVDKTASKGREAGIALEKLQSPLLSAAGAAGSLLAQVTAISAGIAMFSGVGVAARFQSLEVGFTTLLGSAEKARKMLEDLRKMGARTPFNTEELTAYARQLLATGLAGERLIPTLGVVADTIAAMGLGTAEVGRLTRVLGQIRSKEKGLGGNDPIQLSELGINLRDMVNAATGKNMTRSQAESFLDSKSGEEVADILLEGMKRKFGGSAERLGMGTLLGVIQNIGEAFKTIMLPTGALLVPMLTSVAVGIKSLGEGIKNVNDATGGTAGLVVLIGGLWKGASLLTGTISGAVTATRALTLALAQYSGVAMGAAGASAAKGALNPFAGAAAMGPVSRLGGGRILAGNAAAAAKTGFLPALAGFGKSALGKIGGGPAAFIASLGLGFAGSKVGGPAGGALSGIGSGMGIGSLGFLVNPVVGAITTVAGGIIGGIKGYFDAKAAPKGNDPAAQDMKKAADSLRNIELHVIGGGRRAQRVRGEIEIEAAMGRIFATGIG
jgi:hypothetical protein